MNAKQKAAIKKMEAAFRDCFKAGVAIRGQGNSLVAWADDLYSDVEPAAATHKVMVETVNIKHRGVFVDSGADDQLFGLLTEEGRKTITIDT